MTSRDSSGDYEDNKGVWQRSGRQGASTHPTDVMCYVHFVLFIVGRSFKDHSNTS